MNIYMKFVLKNFIVPDDITLHFLCSSYIVQSGFISFAGDIFSRENREDRLKPGQIVKIIDKLIGTIWGVKKEGF